MSVADLRSGTRPGRRLRATRKSTAVSVPTTARTSGTGGARRPPRAVIRAPRARRSPAGTRSRPCAGRVRGPTSSASRSTREPTPPGRWKNRRRSRPTTTTASPASSVSIHAGGSQTVTGTDVVRSPPARAGAAAARAAHAERGEPGARLEHPDLGRARARPADHAEVHADLERLPIVSPSHFPLALGRFRLDARGTRPRAGKRCGEARRKRSDAGDATTGVCQLRRDAASAERGAALGDVGEAGSARRTRSNRSRATTRLPARSSRSASAYQRRRWWSLGFLTALGPLAQRRERLGHAVLVGERARVDDAALGHELARRRHRGELLPELGDLASTCAARGSSP